LSKKLITIFTGTGKGGNKYFRRIFKIKFYFKNKKIFLVDDRVNTGSTLEYAKKLLKNSALIETFAINGKADYSLYNEECFLMPWDEI